MECTSCRLTTTITERRTNLNSKTDAACSAGAAPVQRRCSASAAPVQRLVMRRLVVDKDFHHHLVALQFHYPFLRALKRI